MNGFMCFMATFKMTNWSTWRGPMVNVMLLLLQIIYRLKQVTTTLWRELTITLKDERYQQLMADPWLNYIWTMTGRIIWLTWIDNCLVAGNEDGVNAADEQMKQWFDCIDVGELTEYVGGKIYRKNSIKSTQPVLCKVWGLGKVKIPAEAGSVLVSEWESLSAEEQTKYHSSVG